MRMWTFVDVNEDEDVDVDVDEDVDIDNGVDIDVDVDVSKYTPGSFTFEDYNICADKSLEFSFKVEIGTL